MFRLNGSELAQVRGLIPKRELYLRRPDGAAVLRLEVDPESYWLYTSSAPAASGAVDPARREIARIEQAIRGMDDAVIEKHGGLQGCLERIVELKDLLRSSRPGTAIAGFTTRRSRRLPGGGS